MFSGQATRGVRQSQLIDLHGFDGTPGRKGLPSALAKARTFYSRTSILSLGTHCPLLILRGSVVKRISMKGWKTLLSDKRWLFLLGIIAFAIFASWCENRRRSGTPPVVQKNNRESGNQRPQRPPPKQLPEEFAGTLEVSEQLKPDPAPTGPVTLREVRTGEREEYDRVVFEFEGGLPPGFRVEYIDKLTRKCGSDELKVLGGTWLLVRMTPARARNDSGRTTVEGVKMDDDLKVAKLVRQVCDADGQLEWMIEVNDRKPYRAETLPDPARLVVDIKH